MKIKSTIPEIRKFTIKPFPITPMDPCRIVRQCGYSFAYKYPTTIYFGGIQKEKNISSHTVDNVIVPALVKLWLISRTQCEQHAAAVSDDAVNERKASQAQTIRNNAFKLGIELTKKQQKQLEKIIASPITFAEEG